MNKKIILTAISCLAVLTLSISNVSAQNKYLKNDLNILPTKDSLITYEYSGIFDQSIPKDRILNAVAFWCTGQNNHITPVLASIDRNTGVIVANGVIEFGNVTILGSNFNMKYSIKIKVGSGKFYALVSHLQIASFNDRQFRINYTPLEYDYKLFVNPKLSRVDATSLSKKSINNFNIKMSDIFKSLEYDILNECKETF